MELDARLLLTMGGMLTSVVAAAVLVKAKLSNVIEQLADIEKRLRALDHRVDRSDLTTQRVDTLQGMLAPEKRERLHRSLAKLEARLDGAENEITHLRSMHNSKHPKVTE